ncbi:MAG: hypothetical protein MMC33_005026 [Icmadophila ericetorum]|nr:hypothetical protein [Icmadophila ericetorum]
MTDDVVSPLAMVHRALWLDHSAIHDRYKHFPPTSIGFKATYDALEATNIACAQLIHVIFTGRWETVHPNLMNKAQELINCCDAYSAKTLDNLGETAHQIVEHGATYALPPVLQQPGVTLSPSPRQTPGPPPVSQQQPLQTATVNLVKASQSSQNGYPHKQFGNCYGSSITQRQTPLQSSNIHLSQSQPNNQLQQQTIQSETKFSSAT